MTYAERLRKNLNNNSKETIRVVIYARVSTDNEGQKESCSNQIELANNYIARHSNLEAIGTFVDDGISGKNDFTRPSYNRMLELITTGQVDLVITKALSRLNRNRMNSLILENLLVETETTVLTLEDGQIHDFEDMNSNLLHSINFAIDEQYVRRQSISGRKTHELRCARKELSAKDCSFGYDWDSSSKTISINPDEAEIIRSIFDDFVFKSMGPASIRDSLASRGIDISARSISNYIKDERYIGNFYINKRTSKLGTGHSKSQRIMLPKKEWILVERPDLQIIDTDIFELAQRVNRNRINFYEKPDKHSTQAKFQGFHLFAGKIFCPVCGKPYQFGYADRANTVPYYRIKSHSKCSNPVKRIYENDIELIVKQSLKRTLEQHSDICYSLERILVESVKASQNDSNELKKLEKQLVSSEKQINNLVDSLAEGGLSGSAKERLINRINCLTIEIENLKSAIEDKKSNKISASYVTDKIAEIRSAINELSSFNVLDRDRVLNYIERIELPSDGSVNIIFKTGQRVSLDASLSYNSIVGKKVIQDGQY